MKMDIIGIGTIIVFIGMLIIFIGAFSGLSKGDSKVAVGGFIGFIPFGFANDKNMLWFVIGFSAVIMIIFLALQFFWK